MDVSIKANFRALGARYASRTPMLAAAIASADAVQFVADLRISGTAFIELEGERIDINIGDVVITETPREGWAVAAAEGETLALDLTLTDDLRARGLAREVVRLLQEGRKSAGFAVSDRIRVQWQASDDGLRAAIATHASDIATEVLAVEFTASSTPTAEAHLVTDDEVGLRAWLVLA